ncbi:MAG: serine/threonine-protein kinase [Planctomycetota bacterium]
MASDTRDYIGPYRLLRQIRSAKTTQIWEAMNSTDNRRVAIKVLRKDYAKDRSELASMRHEFDVGSALDHPAVNRVHLFDNSRDLPYVVMDYFRGCNLKQAMREKREMVDDQLPHIVDQCAAGLGHMHEQGWVHRDVKPDNFLVNDQAEVKLIDFAIAMKPKKGLGKLFGGKTAVQGTRSYMAPEQIRGGAPDIRSDIYSLGCTFFELATGKPPFTGSTADDLLTKHLRVTAPAASSLVDHISSEFSLLIAKMMAKRLDQRPQCVADLQAELEQLRVLKPGLGNVAS